MLKLEQKNNGMGISIGVRSRERWFNQSLIAGLIIALLLHGSAIFFFNIQPFRVHYSRSPQLPALVVADLTVLEESQDPQIYAQLEEEKKRRVDPLMPVPSNPELPIVTLPTYKAPSAWNTQSMSGMEQFASVEKEVRTYKEDTHELFLPPMTVTLRGGLAGRKLNWTAPAMASFSDEAPVIHYLAEIQVDEENGSIFWSTPVSIEGESALLSRIEELIDGLSIIPLKKQMISRGMVEITLVAL